MPQTIEVALDRVIDMASIHVEDIESGLKDGTYDKADNANLGDKQEALALVKTLYAILFAGLVPSQDGEPKYYVGKLLERNGEQTNTHIRRFLADDPDLFLDQLASRFLDEDGGDEGDGGYYFNGGAVFVKADSYRQIAKATYIGLFGLIEGACCD